MILTVTLNPSVDYVVRVDQFSTGHLNRTDQTAFYAGGKGINVSQVLKELDIQSTATGFTGGFSGRFIEDTLSEKQIKADFIHVEDHSRINIKLKTDEETEINAAGPVISADKVNELIELVTHYGKGDTLVLAGSIPSSVERDLYGKLAAAAYQNEVQVVIDSEKSLLEPALNTPLTLIKPNHKELGGYIGQGIETVEDAVTYGRQFYNEHSIDYLMVSMAEHGAVLFAGDQTYIATPPKGELINSVGAGDSSVAGFLAGLEKGYSIEDTFALSMACGAATAFSEGLAVKEQIDHYLPMVQIRGLAK